MGIPLGSQFDLNAGLPIRKYMVVNSITDRDNIPAIVRHEGFETYVQGDQKYILEGGVDNANWTPVGGNVTLPLDTKGDLLTYSGTTTKLSVGTNGQILSADSAEPTGLKWINAPTDTNYYLNGASFNTIDGVLTLNVNGATDQTVDLDGRYCTTDTNNYATGVSGSGDGTLTITRSGLADITTDLSHTHSEYVTANNYATGVSGSGDGTLTICRSGLANITANLAHTHSEYLLTTGKAANSNLLDGIDSTAFLRSNTNDTASGRITLTHSVANEATLKVLRTINDGSNTPALIVTNDGEASDVIAEFRSNTSASSVDTSDAPNSVDAKFQICGTGIVCASTCFCAPYICGTSAVRGPNVTSGTDPGHSHSNYLTTYTNNYATGVSGSGDGTLTITRSGLADISTSLAHTHAEYVTANNYATGVSGSGDGTLTITRSGLADITANLAHTHSEYLTSYNNYYATGVSGSGDGTLTITRNGLSSISTNLAHSHAEYLTSNATDYKTAGNLIFYDGVCATFGNSSDLDIYHNGSASYIKNTTGNLYISSTNLYLQHAGYTKIYPINAGACVVGCGFATDWIASSDCRLKKCIRPISNSLSIVNKLCGVNYILCENDSEDIGLIAQDVEKVMPTLVSHSEPSEEQVEKYCIDNNDLLGLKYNKISALLIEAIKEQQIQINDQQTIINDLGNRIKILENENNL